jgi:hypothetical protein
MSGTTRVRRPSESGPSRLFSDPYWYERPLTPAGGTGVLGSLDVPWTAPYAYSIDDLVAEIEGALGTRVRTEWAPVEATTATLVHFDLITGSIAEGNASVVVESGEVAGPTIHDANPFVDVPQVPGLLSDEDKHPTIATEVKQTSRLTIDELAALFPSGHGRRGRMSRENYHRWMRGATQPGSANLQRLLALRGFLRAAADRVSDLRTWLFSPVEEDVTPYDLLRAGALTHVWEMLGRIPSTAPRIVVRDAEGGYGVRIESSLRSGERPTTVDDLDDTSDWIGD